MHGCPGEEVAGSRDSRTAPYLARFLSKTSQVQGEIPSLAML
jgi:hypothetical protein